MLADPVRYFGNSSFRGILFRRTNDELRELKAVSKQLYPRLEGKWSERDSQWTFPSGATLWMTYLDKEDDVLRYQGQAFTWIGFDELTQWPTPHAWDYLRSRLRSANKEIPLFMRACVDEGEVLTEDGWRSIQDIKEGEFVYSVSPEGKLEKKKVHSAVKYEVSESLVRVKKKNLYMSMTPDHRVVYQKYGKNLFDIDRWNEIDTKSVSVLRTSTDYNSEGYTCPIGSWSDLEYARFLGLYVAEGCATTRNRVIITQLKEENHKFISSLLLSGGYNYKYYPNGDFVIHDKGLNRFLTPLGKAHQKHFPREFLDKASKKQLEAAFEAYSLGDGHWQSKTSCTLVTSSPQLCNDLQEIAVKLGYKTQYNKTVYDNPNWKDRYAVYFCSNGKTTKVDKNPEGRNDTTEEFYDGEVYCLGVEDNENFILRQNSFVWISGNTTNPGGPGHAWVKKMFIDPAPWGTSFWATDYETGKILTWPKGHSKEGEPLFKRKFVPAKLSDNPYLYEDGQYEANLLSQNELKRAQLLEGNWDIAEGAAFPEWNRDIHVIDPFEIPRHWTRFRGCDYGYSDGTCVVWIAIDPNTNQLIVYDELYFKNIVASEAAELILERERGQKIRYGVLGSDMWNQRGDSGPSMAEQMIKKGCRWRPSDRSRGSRIAGKNEFHRRLAIDENNQSGIVFFRTCTNCITYLPLIPLDKNNPEDVDTKWVHDHVYDAVRYAIMTRPKPRDDFDMWGEQRQRTGFQIADPVMGY